MAFTVPTNQPVSRTVYGIAVLEAANLPNDFMRANAHRVDRAFSYGEPIAMIVEELMMLYAIRPTWKATKSPRSYAVRVVRA